MSRKSDDPDQTLKDEDSRQIGGLTHVPGQQCSTEYWLDETNPFDAVIVPGLCSLWSSV